MTKLMIEKKLGLFSILTNFVVKDESGKDSYLKELLLYVNEDMLEGKKSGFNELI